MIIKKFRVTNFRSIMDSGWVDCLQVTAIAGENESGKTNLFLALLKFGKQTLAEDEKTTNLESKKLSKLDVLVDPPYKIREKIEKSPDDFVFCSVEYQVKSGVLNAELKKIYNNFTPVDNFIISKTYSGKYIIPILDTMPKELRVKAENIILNSLPIFMYFREVNEFGNEVNLLAISSKIAFVKDKSFTQKEYMYYNLLTCLDIWENNLIKSAKEAYGYFDETIKNEYDFGFILNKVPLLKQRMDKGFEKVNNEFVHWWGDSDIRIGYETYNKGIKIVVFENGTKIALENRSTGFKRFFSLFLSFSMAQKNSLNNAVLLFDEAGAALHPLTQEKLEKFFIELSKNVQLMYNTHTSFMLSIDHLDNARVVYKDSNNFTKVKNNLTINSDRSNEYSLFAPHTSLSLYVAAKQMSGCRPTLVLNESDEIYLGLTKTILQTLGMLNYPYNLLVFAAGQNGIKAVSDIFSSSDGEPPFVCLAKESLKSDIREKLLKETFANNPDKILLLEDNKPFKIDTFEDLFPLEFIAISAKMYLAKFFANTFEPNEKEKFISQVEQHAAKMKVDLPENYRAEIAKRCKLSYMRNFETFKFNKKYIKMWLSIWDVIAAKKTSQSLFVDAAAKQRLTEARSQTQMIRIANGLSMKNLNTSKKFINEYISSKYKNKIVGKCRPNRTKTKLLLADTYFIKGDFIKNDINKLDNKNKEKKAKDRCFMYVYELEDNRLILLINSSIEYVKQLSSENKQIYKSKFPKSGEFYYLLIDNTFKKSSDITQVIDEVISELIIKK